MARVFVHGECSNWSHVWSGIPKGSVGLLLGLLLFLLFVNDLPNRFTNFKMFADDTKVWTTIAGNDDIDKLQKDLDNLSMPY